jgi:Fic family protein
MMEKVIMYQITSEDLKALINEFNENQEEKDANKLRDDLLNRYEDVFVGVREIAKMHKVSPQTVRNYIRDGLITPEPQTVEKGKYTFRLSYVLMLNFENLKKKLKERNY